MATQTILLILLAGFLAWETDMANPKAYPLGDTGDTLMVRIIGYEFCPQNCAIDHFHTGHFDGYDCEFKPCIHITINENWFRKTYSNRLDVHNGIFYVLYVGGLTLYDWSCTCIYTDDNGTHKTLSGKFKSSWKCFR